MKLRDLFSDDAAIDPQAEAVDVKGLAVDSRAVKPGDLFFALAGSKTDGSRFVDSAIQAGAVAVAGDLRRQAAAACLLSSRQIRALRWRGRRRDFIRGNPQRLRQ